MVSLVRFSVAPQGQVNKRLPLIIDKTTGTKSAQDFVSAKMQIERASGLSAKKHSGCDGCRVIFLFSIGTRTAHSRPM